MDQELQMLRDASERQPDRPQPALALARGYARAGRFAEAEAALLLAKQRGASDQALCQLQYVIAKGRGDWIAAAAFAQRSIELEETPSVRGLCAMAAALRRLNDPEGARNAALRALALDPDATQAVAILAWAAYIQSDAEQASAFYRRLIELEPDNIRWRTQLVGLLNVSGQTTEARREVKRIERRWPAHPLIRSVGRIQLADASPEPSEIDAASVGEKDLSSGLESAPSDAELLRPPVVDIVDDDFLVAEKIGAQVTVVVFTGINDQAQGIPLAIFDRYLATLGANAIYLKDFSRLLYINGIASAGTYQATLDRIREAVSRTGATRLVTVGMSAGGSAAIRFGLDLNVSRIICFGGLTYLGSKTITSVYQKIIERRLAMLQAHDALDSKKHLSTSKAASRTDLFYGEEMPRDKDYAVYLQDVPGVTLHPQPGLEYHGVAPYLAESGSILSVLRSLLPQT